MTAYSIALLGFGEVGQTFGADLGAHRLSAFDIGFGDAASAPSRAIRGTGIRRCDSAAELVAGCDIVVSAVTPGEAENAAASIAAGLVGGTSGGGTSVGSTRGDGAWVMDVNSISPGARQRAADIVESAGGRYVEAAMMAPVAPARIASPILLGGPHARRFEAIASSIGFAGARRYDDTLGRASATKLCRSVVVKGLESLVTEALLAGRHYGVETAVVESLANLFEDSGRDDWSQYLISRSLRHGARRASEMLEASATVAGAGVEPLMSRACASRQAQTARLASALGHAESGHAELGHVELGHTELGKLLDAMRRAGARAEDGRTC